MDSVINNRVFPRLSLKKQFFVIYSKIKAMLERAPLPLTFPPLPLCFFLPHLCFVLFQIILSLPSSSSVRLTPDNLSTTFNYISLLLCPLPLFLLFLLKMMPLTIRAKSTTSLILWGPSHPLLLCPISDSEVFFLSFSYLRTSGFGPVFSHCFISLSCCPSVLAPSPRCSNMLSFSTILKKIHCILCYSN